MTRGTKIAIAALAGSALLVGAVIVAAALWLVVRSEPTAPAYDETAEAYDEIDNEAYDEEYADPIEAEFHAAERELEAAEKELGPNHEQVARLLFELAEMEILAGRDVAANLERAARILERERSCSPLHLDVLDLLARADALSGNHAGSIHALERALECTDARGDPVDRALLEIDLAAAHVRAGHDGHVQPLVTQARRRLADCEARGDCLGDELLDGLAELDFARVERALDQGDTSAARRWMHDITARATRDGADPCDELVDVVFDRVNDRVLRCEQLARTGKHAEANRVYESIFTLLGLAETAGDCTELVDPYLVSDLTLTILRVDLEARRYPSARQRIERLSQYARLHFDRGELRDLMRYDVTDLVLELAEEAADDDRLDDAHELQRFILRLYASTGLSDSPTMCEIVRTMSDADLAELDEHLAAGEIEKAELLVERLRARYDDYRVRRCAPEVFHELAVTFADHALDAFDRRKRDQARALMSIGTGLCKSDECRRELREIERELR